MSENTEKILNGILQKQKVIEKLLILLIPDLKTKKGVANFFGVNVSLQLQGNSQDAFFQANSLKNYLGRQKYAIF